MNFSAGIGATRRTRRRSSSRANSRAAARSLSLSSSRGPDAAGSGGAERRRAREVARQIEQPLERRWIKQQPRAEREHPLERGIGEDQLVLRIELGHPGRHLIEHRPLGIAEGAEGAALLLHFLDIDRVAGNPVLTQRQVGNLERAALAAARRNRRRGNGLRRGGNARLRCNCGLCGDRRGAAR